MILFPPAKINLGLNILRKRDDGYHEIDTCMMDFDLTDVLELLPASELKFHQSGLTVDAPSDDNLCVRAFRLMEERFNIPPVYIHLRKNIPMGAGLGGGSADAAYVVRGLNELNKLGLSSEEMSSITAELGSDCPFFVEGGFQIAKGRGEVLRKIDLHLSGYFLKVINPGIHVGTAEAYAGVVPNDRSESVASILDLPIEHWRDSLKNDFEISVFDQYPQLKEMKDNFYKEGAVYAAMSGSGSTMYGLYKQKPELTETDQFQRIIAL